MGMANPPRGKVCNPVIKNAFIRQTACLPEAGLSPHDSQAVRRLPATGRVLYPVYQYFKN